MVLKKVLFFCHFILNCYRASMTAFCQYLLVLQQHNLSQNCSYFCSDVTRVLGVAFREMLVDEVDESISIKKFI